MEAYRDSMTAVQQGVAMTPSKEMTAQCLVNKTTRDKTDREQQKREAKEAIHYSTYQPYMMVLVPASSTHPTLLAILYRLRSSAISSGYLLIRNLLSYLLIYIVLTFVRPITRGTPLQINSSTSVLSPFLMFGFSLLLQSSIFLSLSFVWVIFIFVKTSRTSLFVLST